MIQPEYWLILVLYTLFFLGFTVFKTFSPKLDKLIFCSVCIAYFSVLVISFILPSFPILLQAMMIGMSATGLAKSGSEYFEGEWYGNFFLLQLTMTIIGEIVLLTLVV